MNNPPAGWYDDPSSRDLVRYWDGERWTEHVRTVGKLVDDQVSHEPNRTNWSSTDQVGAGTTAEIIADRAQPPRPRFTRRRIAMVAVTCLAVFVVLGMLSPSDDRGVVIDTSATSIVPVPDVEGPSAADQDVSVDQSPETPDALANELDDTTAGVWSDDDTGAVGGAEAQPGLRTGTSGAPVEFASSVWVVRTLAIGWASPDGWEPVRYVVTVRWSSGKKSFTTVKESLTVKGASKQGCMITITAVDGNGGRVSTQPFACGTGLG